MFKDINIPTKSMGEKKTIHRINTQEVSYMIINFVSTFEHCK